MSVMCGFLSGCVGYVVTNGGVLTYGCAIGVYGAYVDMAICIICWLILSICIHSEMISTSLECIRFLN